MKSSTLSVQYSAVAKCLHWLIAFAIIAMLAIGWIMTDMEKTDALKFQLFQWHKSIGLTILVLSLFRLLWRLTYRAPPFPVTMQRWEKMAARLTHFIFYLLIIGMPLSGWLIVSTSRLNLPTMFYGLFQWPNLPETANLANKQEINHLAGNIHGLAAYILAGLIVLHVGAAWKHHLFERDDVLLRMAPRFLQGLLKRLQKTR